MMNRYARWTLLAACTALGSITIVSGCSEPPPPVEPTVAEYPTLDKITAGVFLEPDAAQGRSGEPIRAVTDAGLDLLKEYEGEVKCKPQTSEQMHCPYNDSSRYCTIGHGHLIDKADCASIEAKLEELGFKDGISQAEADDILRADLAVSQLGIERQLDAAGMLGLAGLTDAQYDALVSFTFNVGVGNFQRSTLLKKLKTRPDMASDVAVAEQILRWNRSNGEFVQGLAHRREKEVSHFFTGYELPVVGRSASEDDGIDVRQGEP